MTSSMPPQQPTQPTQQLPPHRPEKPARSTSASVILITTSVVGGLALLGATASAAFGMWVPEVWEAVDNPGSTTEYTGNGSNTEFYADAIGVTSIDIDAAASAFSLEFGDVEEAVLTVKGAEETEPNSANGWTLERDGDELTVDRSGSRSWGDVCVIGCSPRLTGDHIVILTLPTELGEGRSTNLDVTVSAGSFTGSGSFDEVDLELNAGELTFTGDARTVDVDVAVGSATVALADVEEATVSVVTGEGTLTLTGAAPTRVELSAEMGSLTVKLPVEKYRVDVKAELGSIDNRLTESKDSKHVVSVRAELADVILK